MIKSKRMLDLKICTSSPVIFGIRRLSVTLKHGQWRVGGKMSVHDERCCCASYLVGSVWMRPSTVDRQKQRPRHHLLTWRITLPCLTDPSTNLCGCSNYIAMMQTTKKIKGSQKGKGSNFSISKASVISYERGFSFFCLYKAQSDTPATLTTLNRTPGISPTA